MRVISLLLYWCLFSVAVLAQDTDVVRPTVDTSIRRVQPDTTPVRRIVRKPVPKPSAVIPVPVDTILTQQPVPGPQEVEIFRRAVATHPYYNFSGKPLNVIMEEKKREGNEPMFYALIALLLFFSMIRLGFDKYLNNMLTLFFRVTMRQQQLRDQLLGAPLPSLLLNLMFIINTGIYLAFVAESNGFLENMNFWIRSLYGMLLVTAIYFVKFIVLKILGWVFNVPAATDTYTFVVFLVNKMIGICLLPLIVVMSFASPALLKVLVVFSYFMIGGFFIYRFLIAFRPIRNEIKVNRFHFFLYLCAFEIAPLMLIYKVLLDFVEKSY